MRYVGFTFLLFGLVWNSTNAQKGWFAVDAPFANLNWLGVDFLNDDFGIVVGEQGRIKRTTNGGKDWEFRESGVSETLNGIDVVDENLAFAVGYSGNVLKTSNGGDTWVKLTIPDMTETLLDVFFYNEIEGFVSGARGTLLKTTDGGNTWGVQDAAVGKNNIWEIQAFDRNRLIICGNAGSISYTTNGGLKWKKQETPFSNEIYAISFADSLHGFCVGVSATIMRTLNGGAEWTVFDPGFPIPTLPLNGVAMPDIYHVYACGWSAMIVATNDGVNWEVQDVPTDYAGTHLTAITFPSPTTGYVVGWNGTILKTVNGGTLAVEEPGLVPGEYEITGMYPNPVPAGSQMHIRFSAPIHENVSISVFDILGNKRMVIGEDQLDQVSQTQTFNTAGLSNGMYFITVQSPGKIRTAAFIVR